MTLTHDAEADQVRPAEETAAASPRSRLAALAGAASGGLGLGVGALLAHLLAPGGSPVPSVSELILRLLPPALINFGKEALGAADKPVLNLLVLLGALALATLAGHLGAHRRRVGYLLLSGLSVLALAAVLLAPDGLLRNAFPVVVGWVVAVLALRALLRRLPMDQGDPIFPSDLPTDRRRFLALAGLTGGGAVLAGAGTLVLPEAGASSSAASAIQLPQAAVPAAPIPAGADFRLPGLAPYVTPNDAFYRIDTAFVVPRLQVEDWTLRIVGKVEREIELSMADVLARPLEEHDVTLTCVSNVVGGSLIGNARWLGLRLSTLLAEARPLPGADMVLSRSADDFTAGTPLEFMTDPNRPSLLAVGMNGEPLPVKHGFPARLVVPGLYGYVSATKWVVELKLTSFADDQGYWTPLGWSAKGPIKLSSRIDTPIDAVDAGTVVLAGVAWSQHVGISRVQVRIDDADWADADLADVSGPDTWRQWRLEWSATPGEHTVAVRAVDADGLVQDERVRDVLPDGATGLDTRTISVR